MKVKEKEHNINSEIKNVFLISILYLVDYADEINNCVDNKEFIDLSDLYKNLISKDWSEDQFVEIITKYLCMFYIQMEHFQRREIFESCTILNSALRKELEWNLKYVFKNFGPEFKNKIATIEEEIKKYYLD